MLGNFSFGDYFKHEAIQLAWQLLTSKKWFNLTKEKLLVTVYATDDETYNIWANNIGLAKKRIIRIGDNKGSAYASDNFWHMGTTGPCGPCSEIFYDHGDHLSGGLPGTNEEHGDRYVEIWNLVFMQFNRKIDGTMQPLPKPSVDTGMGLERIAAVLQHVHANYDIDLFSKLITAIVQVILVTDLNNKSLRVIADHIRSCAFLVTDGVMPSNEGHGYVLRRLIRRAIRHGNLLGASTPFFYKLVAPLIEVMGSVADQLKSQQDLVEKVLRTEEEQFANTLERGLALLDEELTKRLLAGNHKLDGETAFRFYDTYGFPLDLTSDVCRERNFTVDEAGFQRAMTAQRQRSSDASVFRSVNYHHHHSNRIIQHLGTTRFVGYEHVVYQCRVTALLRDGQLVTFIKKGEYAVVFLDVTPFYSESGGQVGDSGELQTADSIFKVEDTKKYGKVFGHKGKLSYGELKVGAQVIANVDDARRDSIRLNHSATHLLHAALRQVLGKHVWQKGSLVNDKYLRFDFSHNKAMNTEQIHIVESIINKQIRRNLPINTKIMTLDAALNQGATALFSDKSDTQTQVRVLSIGDFSTELCGGIHANRTGDIGLFHIRTESGAAAGIRRIEAVTGEEALATIHQQSNLIQLIANQIKLNGKISQQNIVYHVRKLHTYANKLAQQLQQLKRQQVVQHSALLTRNVRYISSDIKILVHQIDKIEPQMLRLMVDELKKQLGSSAVIILATVLADSKISLIAGVTPDLTNRINAGSIMADIARQVGGKGGGRSDLAYAGGHNVASLRAALANVDAMLTQQLSNEQF